MYFKIELQSTGVNELKAKVEQADRLFNELKNVLNEISEASINVSLSNVIKGQDLLNVVNRSTNRR